MIIKHATDDETVARLCRLPNNGLELMGVN